MMNFRWNYSSSVIGQLPSVAEIEFQEKGDTSYRSTHNTQN